LENIQKSATYVANFSFFSCFQNPFGKFQKSKIKNSEKQNRIKKLEKFEKFENNPIFGIL
tara:strand:+ start:147 stop:326 length:180 start_codon:yes stop_codon:yes gene_type:complete